MLYRHPMQLDDRNAYPEVFLSFTANEPQAGVELRPMEPADLEEVKSLHEQCFPVRYDNVSARLRF